MYIQYIVNSVVLFMLFLIFSVNSRTLIVDELFIYMYIDIYINSDFLTEKKKGSFLTWTLFYWPVFVQPEIIDCI